ncbi:cytochrome P450 4g15-like [Planococcus citri]|uniref:cytochrome P450 4g15-like n=1 Tax=Planococcus citri TaxID=170843 RepID=UPI0031F8B23E
MNVIAIFVCLTIIVIILLKIFDRFKNKRMYELLEKFPSYPTYPFIGNLYMLCGSSNGEFLKKLNKLIEPYDRQVFWFGFVPILFLKKHEDIMAIHTQSQYRETLGFADEWIGTGIINAKYEEWRKSRKILTPAFSSEMLSKYTVVFNKNSSALVNALRQVADTGEVINVWDYLMKTNVHSIVENVMGVSIQTSGKEGQQFGDAVYKTVQNILKRMISPWLHPSFIYFLYLKITGESKVMKQLHHIPMKILKEKLTEYRNGNLKYDDVHSSKTVIDQLIKESLHEPSFTETRMRNELLHVTGASIETTTLNVGFLMLMLAIHQDIQQKVYEEITELLTDDEILTPDHLFNQLKYLEQCIKETSRKYTPVLGTFRRTHKECTLKDNKIVPKNTMVFSAFHWAHCDKELFENPHKWDPDHFNEQNEQTRSKNGFLSFGYGPRSCIGAKYAMMSMKTEISHILRSYHLSTNIKELTDDHLCANMSIRSKIGFPIKFTSRQKLHK